MQKNEDILSIMSNLQSNCCLNVDFQKVDQHAGGTIRTISSYFLLIGLLLHKVALFQSKELVRC